MLPNKSLKRLLETSSQLINRRMKKYISRARTKMLLWVEPVIECLMEAGIFQVKFIQTKYGSDTKWRKQCEQKDEVRNGCGICLEVKGCVNS